MGNGSNKAVVSWSDATASDNDGIADLSADQNSGSAFGIGSTDVTYTATDNAGLTASCTFTITVGDSEYPVITCPSNIDQNTDADSDKAVVSWAVPSPTDNAGNSASCSFTVTVTDNQAPEFTSCPGDISKNAATGSTSATATWSEPQSTDNVGIVSTSSTHSSGDSFDLGNTEVVYTITDAAGLSDTCKFVVTVVDTQPPQWTNCPDDITQDTDAGVSTAAVSWTEPTASDNSAIANSGSTHAPGDSFTVGDTIVEYSATDDSGLTSLCSFTVTIEDNEDPVLSDCAADIVTDTDVGQAYATVSWSTISAVDNVDGTILASTDVPSGSSFSIGGSTVTATASDSNGNSDTCTFTVTVNDNEAPIITGCPNADVTGTTDANSNKGSASWGAITATDAVDGTVSTTSSHQSGSLFNHGTTEVTVTATDSSSNTQTCTFNVVISDNENPSWSGCPQDITVQVDDGASTGTATWNEPTASDNVYSTLDITQGPHSSGYSGFTVGSTTITYQATDGEGNTGSCQFSVIVEDDEGPVITGCPTSYDVNTDAGEKTAIVSFSLSASDSVDGDIDLVQTSGLASGSEFPIGTTNQEFTATDSNDNTNTCTFTVTVTDNEAPM